MKIPLQITFRNVDPSEALEEKIRQRARKLERFDNEITSCRVVVEAPHRHHQKGGVFNVKVDLSVRDGELVANRSRERRREHSDVYIAAKDAFNAACRQLENHIRRRQGQLKTHEAPPSGRVSHLVREEGYGRIETVEGRDIYFHRNSLVNASFDQLKIGTKVQFTEVPGDAGPQASAVKVEGRGSLEA